MTTKESIYANALHLFSEHGYSNVGMRMLAKNVGIKASSIYNHYKSKEDILLQIANELVNEMKKEVYPLFKNTALAPREFFSTISLQTNLFFEKINIETLTKLLIPEEFTCERLRELLYQEFIIKPRGAYEYYFNNLMNKGKMRQADPKFASKIYHSFFVYHFYEKFLSDDPNRFLTNKEELFKNHINWFMDYFQIQ